jgi:hypothetical protein
MSHVGLWWFTPVILATWEAEIERTVVWGQLRQIVCETPITKLTRTKWIVGVAQGVQCMLWKQEGLNSSPSSTTTNKKKWVNYVKVHKLLDNEDTTFYKMFLVLHDLCIMVMVTSMILKVSVL